MSEKNNTTKKGDLSGKKEESVASSSSVLGNLTPTQIETLRKLRDKSPISEPISVIAHQLKNPLAVLRGYTEALLSENFGKINGKQREYLGDSLENIKKMLHMINDLLDVAKIDAGKFEAHLKPVDLVEVCREVKENFFYWAKASNCEIIFNPPDNFPPVMVDSLKIYDVVENLVANAVKYKSAGPGRIELALEQRNGTAVFSCRDNGVGIPKNDYDKVFTKFYRSEGALEIDPSGTGIGLYIIKTVIEMSGGQIWFESEENKGTAFFFSLPIAQAGK